MLRTRIERRLQATSPGGDPLGTWMTGLAPEQIERLRGMLPADPARAAVMLPIVDRPDGLTLLLTRRAAHLRHHPGQISFPGGRVEPGDEGPWAAALREAEEEIGLPREHVTLAGFLRDQLVISGYIITPAVAFVRPGFELRLDATEVEDAFEVPLAFVLDRSNHVERSREFAGFTFTTHDIPYRDRHIWGATAGMLRSLCELLGEE